MSLSTYAAHRKMNDEQLELALQLVEQNATNKVIVDTINARFPEIQTVAKDISNIRRRFDGLTYSDSKDMRKFIIKLESAGYHIAYDVDKGHVTSFFFTQDNCIQRARRLSEVLVIDATYKTNIYKLPLVNIVGVNNVGLDRHRLATFAVAGAWISNEKTDSYTWIIQKLSEMVYENGHSTVLPNVIVSDNEQALINAINAIYLAKHFDESRKDKWSQVESSLQSMYKSFHRSDFDAVLKQFNNDIKYSRDNGTKCKEYFERPEIEVAKQLSINENPDAVFDKGEKRGRKTVLITVVQATEQFAGLKITKNAVYEFMTKECNLSIKRAHLQAAARNDQDQINQRCAWVQHWRGTDMNYLQNCVFLDESSFHINMRRGIAWSKKGTKAEVVTPSTRAQTTSILGAISAAGIIKISLRTPKPSKKRKTKSNETIRTGTVAGHFLSFIKATMDEMDKYGHMRGQYLIMDNAPIHTNRNIGRYITSRGYRFAYLPPYSPELNPLEQFWSVVKSKVKRSLLSDQETLLSRIAEACDSMPTSNFVGFAGHSERCFEKCLNKEPL
ncbi:hypothetical protein VTP01DRAFT_2655 [Rhizomucor pusillus]|uniref:uncharacterized protein n=1 Tax=Rhizomucor pusillus TaxID=4840 RepID=UPI00374398E2